MDGETDGLARVLETHRAALLRFLTARLGEAAAAEDALQDVWLKIAAGGAAGPVADPVPYLYRMCENAARDARRSRLRRETRERGWSEHMGQDRPDSSISPERIAAQRDFLQKLQRELETLPGRTRRIFLAYRVDGRSQKDIAGEEGVSLSAVEKHLQRAYRLVAEFRRRETAERDGS